MRVLRSRSFSMGRGGRRRADGLDATLKFKINPQSDGVLWV